MPEEAPSAIQGQPWTGRLLKAVSKVRADGALAAKRSNHEDIRTMRKVTALAVALGFLAATSLPTIAAPAANKGDTTFSAQSQTADHAVKKPAQKRVMKKVTKRKAVARTAAKRRIATHTVMKRTTKKQVTRHIAKKKTAMKRIAKRKVMKKPAIQKDRM
jgi:hypothetical protein